MRTFLSYVLLFIFVSCSSNDKPKNEVISVKRKIVIDDYFSINNLMKNGDTMIMKISLAVCTSDRKDSLIFFKKNNKVYLRFFVLGEFKDTFDVVEYLPSDKVYSVEEILKRYKLTDSVRQRSWIKIYLKNNDSLYATKGTSGLIDRLQFLHYYDSVMKQIYEPNNIEYSRNVVDIPTIEN
jgi:hypothetical protein